jgi:hypothetical protein
MKFEKLYESLINENTEISIDKFFTKYFGTKNWIKDPDFNEDMELQTVDSKKALEYIIKNKNKKIKINQEKTKFGSYYITFKIPGIGELGFESMDLIEDLNSKVKINEETLTEAKSLEKTYKILPGENKIEVKAMIVNNEDRSLKELENEQNHVTRYLDSLLNDMDLTAPGLLSNDGWWVNVPDESESYISQTKKGFGACAKGEIRILISNPYKAVEEFKDALNWIKKKGFKEEK